MRTKSLAMVVLAGALAAGCSSGAPSVEIVEATQSIVVDDDGRDDVELVLHYEDPDGDLGRGHAVVVDCRSADVRASFDIPSIANEDAVKAGVTIEGELDLVVTDVGAVTAGPLPAECAEAGAPAGAFCVILVDEAGNESPPACTEPIRIDGGAE